MPSPSTLELQSEGILTVLEPVLNMTVNSGFDGQKLRSNPLRKLSALQQMIAQHGAICKMEVYGGINPKAVASVVGTGSESSRGPSGVFNPKATVAENIAAPHQSRWPGEIEKK